MLSDMTPGLDLSSSHAKVKRAADHLETLNRELRANIHESHPYSIVPDFNKENGWLSLKFKPEPADLGFSVVLGELIHDLRSALDHIVSALVAANGATLTIRHQFPIYTDETTFDNRVGTAASPKRDLEGITFGFDEIRRIQPFVLKPNPSAAALALLQRLSNSDKHRLLVMFTAIPERHEVRVSYDAGQIIDHWEPTGHIMWEPQVETEFLRLRFAQPYPTKINPEADLEMGLWFMDRAFPPGYPNDRLVSLVDLNKVGMEVEAIIQMMEAL